jgi:hypothetical protein
VVADVDRPGRVEVAVNAPVLKSVISVPTVTTWSRDSTNARTSSSMSLPSSMPMYAGRCSSRTDL